MQLAGFTQRAKVQQEVDGKNMTVSAIALSVHTAQVTKISTH